jgi:hypothetical protein
MHRQRTDPASICRPCRRAHRWHRSEHRCYGAVQGEDRADATTWVACGCDCQRTLASLGFYDDGAPPPTEVVPAPVGQVSPASWRGPDSPAP